MRCYLSSPFFLSFPGYHSWNFHLGHSRGGFLFLLSFIFLVLFLFHSSCVSLFIACSFVKNLQLQLNWIPASMVVLSSKDLPMLRSHWRIIWVNMQLSTNGASHIAYFWIDSSSLLVSHSFRPNFFRLSFFRIDDGNKEITPPLVWISLIVVKSATGHCDNAH